MSNPGGLYIDEEDTSLSFIVFMILIIFFMILLLPVMIPIKIYDKLVEWKGDRKW